MDAIEAGSRAGCSGRESEGRASFYASKFHGRRTASGETFNMHDMTAAHRSLPFGTQVRVTDMRSCRSVVVRINDRGPFVKGRVIDLSVAAADQLGFRRHGTTSVAIERLN
ncbi:MAG: septal ring lytic transglycosylase RlpA family protein [Hyphomicrobiales bacterium]